jgi:ribosomal protein L40E
MRIFYCKLLPCPSWYNAQIMSPESTSTKLCPTCGTRLTENATRCVVCGSEFSATPKPNTKSGKAIQGSRMPQVTLSLPVALAVLASLALHRYTSLFKGLTKFNPQLPSPVQQPLQHPLQPQPRPLSPLKRPLLHLNLRLNTPFKREIVAALLPACMTLPWAPSYP